MQSQSQNTSTVILPAAVLAAFVMCLGCVVILTIQTIWFLSAKFWGLIVVQTQPQAENVVYPEQTIGEIFKDDVIREEEEETQPISEPSVETVTETVTEESESEPEVAVDEVATAEPGSHEDDETLVQASSIGLDEALHLLTGINRKGWHTMLQEIGERQQTAIPKNYKQMSKNNTRATALLQLNVSAKIALHAREIALQRQSQRAN